MQSLNEIAENQYEAIAAYCLKRTGGDEQLARECGAAHQKRLGTERSRYAGVLG